MNWRVFQGGFIIGTILAAYSQSTGAAGFQTAADLVAAGALFGVLSDALWAVLRLQWQLSREKAQRMHQARRTDPPHA